MKYCWRCRQDLSKSKFGRLKTSKDGLHKTCKKCSNAARKERAFRLVARYKILLRLIKKSEGCQICGTTDYVILDFHHLDKKSIRRIGSIPKKSTGKVVPELRKCCVLCANDHRRVEAGVIDTKLVRIDVDKYLPFL